jgi:flagellar biosynthesis/type III secretory pathway protein FliH
MKVKADAWKAELSQNVTSLVINSLRQILADIPPSEAVSSTVLRALKGIDPGSDCVLYLSTAQFDNIKAKLLDALEPETASKLALREDPELPPTACRLVSEFGIVDLSVGKQLEILIESLRAAGAGVQV